MIQELQCCISLVNPCAYSHAAGYFPGLITIYTVYPKKYAHGFVVLCFVVVMQSFIMNSHEVFIHIHQGCFAGTGAIVRLPQCQWSKPDGYGEISQCITTTKHSKATTLCIFLGIYCTYQVLASQSPVNHFYLWSSLASAINIILGEIVEVTQHLKPHHTKNIHHRVQINWNEIWLRHRALAKPYAINDNCSNIS